MGRKRDQMLKVWEVVYAGIKDRIACIESGIEA